MIKTSLIVGGIDQNLVHDLEETGNVSNLAIDHSFGIRVKCPHHLCDSLYTADIRIRPLEDVLDLRKLESILRRVNFDARATYLGISLRDSFFLLIGSGNFMLNRWTCFVVGRVNIHDTIVCILVNICERFLLRNSLGLGGGFGGGFGFGGWLLGGKFGLLPPA